MRLRACIVALTLSLASRLVLAAPANEEDATSRYRRASQLLRDNRPADALVEADASLAKLPSPNTELLRAHALRLLGREPEAMVAYRHVEAEAGARVRAGEERFRPTLEDAGRWIAVLRNQLALLTLDVDHAPAGATVTIDGARAATASAGAPLHVESWRRPGRVVVELRDADGVLRDSRDLVAEAGHSESIELTPKIAVEAPAESGAVRPPPPAAWVAGGVGATGMIFFAVFGGLAESAASELRACAPRCDPTDPALRDAADHGKTYATAANVSVALGAVALTTGAALWLFWPTDASPSAATLHLEIGPARVAVHGAF